MKKSSGQRDAATLKWTPRLKNSAQGAGRAANSGTNLVADRALSTIGTIDRFLAAGGDAEDAYISTLATRGRPPQALSQAASVRPSRATDRRPSAGRRRLLCAGVAIASTVLAGLFASGVLQPTHRHTVVGKVWLERRPLGAAELTFHPVGRDDPRTVVAAEDGRFELAGVAAGTYRVTVQPPAGSAAVAVAANYTKPDSTPFQLHVNRDVASLQLHAHKILPKARKATWTPGVD